MHICGLCPSFWHRTLKSTGISPKWQEGCAVCLVTQLCLTLQSHGPQPDWSGFPCPPPGDLPNLVIKPRSPALQADSLHLSGQGSPVAFCYVNEVTFREKEMATHSSTLAWRIPPRIASLPWREEPGRLQSMGSQRVRHDWATSLVT